MGSASGAADMAAAGRGYRRDCWPLRWVGRLAVEPNSSGAAIRACLLRVCKSATSAPPAPPHKGQYTAPGAPRRRRGNQSPGIQCRRGAVEPSQAGRPGSSLSADGERLVPDVLGQRRGTCWAVLLRVVPIAAAELAGRGRAGGDPVLLPKLHADAGPARCGRRVPQVRAALHPFWCLLGVLPPWRPLRLCTAGASTACRARPVLRPCPSARAHRPTPALLTNCCASTADGRRAWPSG